jgi:hypothetical protein
MTKPRTACPTGQADAAENMSSRPLRSAARAHNWVGAVHWHPPLRRVSCLGIVTRPPHHLQRLSDKLRERCLHAIELQQPTLATLCPHVHTRAAEHG